MTKILYKFTPIRDEFFGNRLVRITQRTELNDPYEFYPVEADIQFYRKYGPPKSVENFKISESFLIDHHLNCMGVMSFTESKDNFLMWSHYGDEHKGIAIGFDATHNFFKEAFPVTYTPCRNKKGCFYEYDEGLKITYEPMFKKSTHWAHEKEWRISDSLVTSDCLIKDVFVENKMVKTTEWYPKRVDLFPWEKPIMYFKQIPAEAILSITFGCRVKEEEVLKTLGVINQYPELKHIKKYRIKLKKEEYKMEFEEINDTQF